MNKMFFASIAAACCMAITAQAADRKNLPAPMPAGATRVAVVNLGLVFSKYQKAQDFKDHIARSMKKIQDEGKALAKEMAGWQQALQKNEFKNGTKELYEEKMINGRRRLEDLSRQASLTVGKSQQTHLQELWRDVHDAVRTYSAKQRIDLVFAYGDPVQKELIPAFPNVDRKLRNIDQGGAMPFFIGSGSDISAPVLEILNQKYRAEKTKASPGVGD
jgi:Skp family chaperone for outer membrane proteins